MKVGDKVRVVKGTQSGAGKRDDRDIGRVGVIYHYDKTGDDDLPWLVDLDACNYESAASYYYAEEDLEVIE